MFISNMDLKMIFAHIERQNILNMEMQRRIEQLEVALVDYELTFNTAQTEPKLRGISNARRR